MKTLHHRGRVAFEFKKMKEGDLATFADAVAGKLTGNATFPSPPVAPSSLSGQAAALRATLAQIAAGTRSAALTQQKSAAKVALTLSLIAVGHYVEDTANTTAAGDASKAEQLIASTGFAVAKKPTSSGRSSGIVGTGAGWVHARAKNAARGEVHVWRYGLAPSKGTPPQTLITLVTVEADIVIRDLASGTTVAVQHAGVLPVGRRGAKPSGGPGNELTALPTTQSRHPVFSHMQSDPYAWSGFLYAVVP